MNLDGRQASATAAAEPPPAPTIVYCVEVLCMRIQRDSYAFLFFHFFFRSVCLHCLPTAIANVFSLHKSCVTGRINAVRASAIKAIADEQERERVRNEREEKHKKTPCQHLFNVEQILI